MPRRGRRKRSLNRLRDLSNRRKEAALRRHVACGRLSQKFVGFGGRKGGSSRKRVRAVEPNEMGPDDCAAAHQALRPLFEQHHPLFTARTYRLDEPSAEGKLLYEGRWDPKKRCRDQNRFVRSMRGQTLRSIADGDLDVRDAKTSQVGSGGNGNVGPAFYTPHEARQVGEQRRLEAVARADFKDALRTRKSQGLDHLR